MNKLKIINKFIATTFIVTCFMSAALATANANPPKGKKSKKIVVNNDYFANFAKNGDDGRQWNEENDLTDEDIDDMVDFFGMVNNNYYLDNKLCSLIMDKLTEAAPYTNIIEKDEDFSSILNFKNELYSIEKELKQKKSGLKDINSLADNLYKNFLLQEEEN